MSEWKDRISKISEEEKAINLFLQSAEEKKKAIEEAENQDQFRREKYKIRNQLSYVDFLQIPIKLEQMNSELLKGKGEVHLINSLRWEETRQSSSNVDSNGDYSGSYFTIVHRRLFVGYALTGSGFGGIAVGADQNIIRIYPLVDSYSEAAIMEPDPTGPRDFLDRLSSYHKNYYLSVDYHKYDTFNKWKPSYDLDLNNMELDRNMRIKIFDLNLTKALVCNEEQERKIINYKREQKENKLRWEERARREKKEIERQEWERKSWVEKLLSSPPEDF